MIWELGMGDEPKGVGGNCTGNRLGSGHAIPLLSCIIHPSIDTTVLLSRCLSKINHL